jgi:hypothetical protein
MRARLYVHESRLAPSGLAAVCAALLWAAATNVGAVALSDVSADALLSVTFTPSVGVTASSFVTDDGQNPLTTYAYRDPDGIAGSSAVAGGSVSNSAAHSLRFTASDNTQAAGAPDPSTELAWAQTTLGGGFLIDNSLTADINATIAVEWSWVMGLSAAGSPIDLGVGQLSIELLIDGVSLAVPVDELLSTPSSGPFAGSGTFTTTVTIPAQSFREVSLTVFSLGVAQSTVPAVPVPGTALLLFSSLAILRSFDFRWRILASRGAPGAARVGRMPADPPSPHHRNGGTCRVPPLYLAQVGISYPRIGTGEHASALGHRVRNVDCAPAPSSRPSSSLDGIRGPAAGREPACTR